MFYALGLVVINIGGNLLLGREYEELSSLHVLCLVPTRGVE
jgi:hypothetical protein